MNFYELLAVVQKTDPSTQNMNIIIIVAIIIIIILVSNTIFSKRK